MTAADYFSMNRYEGKIYKTTNMQGKVLANYCKTDSAMVKEQKRIEKQLTDFEKHVWGHQDSLAVDSAKVEADENKKEEKASKSSRSSRRSSSAKSESAKEEKAKVSKTKKEKSPQSSSSAPRVTVRRQRR